MAPMGKRKSGKFNVNLSLNNALDFGKAALFDPAKTWVVAVLLCIAEVLVNLFVIWKVKCKNRMHEWQKSASVQAILVILMKT
jgi:SNF family Na+-dependent transporter